jgi:hypothetical protein
MKRWSDFDSLAVLVAAIGALEAGAVASGTVAWDAAIGEAGAGGVAVEGAVVCALAQSVVDSSKAAAQANFVVMRYSSFARVARVCGDNAGFGRLFAPVFDQRRVLVAFCRDRRRRQRRSCPAGIFDGRKKACSFLKKRTKKLLSLGVPDPATVHPKDPKFFGSFF